MHAVPLLARVLAVLAAATALAPAAAGPGPQAGRLPRTVVPIAYDLHLTVDPRRPTFAGEVAIHLRLDAPTDRVLFHAYGPEIHEAWLDGEEGAVPVAVRDTAGAKEGGIHGGEKEALLGGERTGPLVLRMRWRAPFPDVLAGLYRAREDGRWYAVTQFEPLDARRAFPCLDEPGFKTPFRIRLTVPEGMVAATNSPETSRSAHDGQVTVTFAPTEPLPTYLIAFAAGPYDVVEGPQEPVPIRGLCARGKGGQMAEALRMHAEILAVLSDWFGRPYPYAKLDVVAALEFEAGAMENAGLIIYREGYLLLDAAATSEQTRRGAARIIAHELAHQWFGDLVTLSWWDDLWLNEAFAEWMAAKAVDRWNPSHRRRLQALEGRGRVLAADALDTARPIRTPSAGAEVDLQSFGRATYKGAHVLSMLERWTGEPAFQAGVRAYLQAHAHGNAVADDLFRALDAAAPGKRVRDILTTFLDQPGVPLVEAAWSCSPEGASVTLRQRRYRGLPHDADAVDPSRWVFPVCLDYRAEGGAGMERCVLFDGDALEVPLDPAPERCAFVHPNDDEQGYYRWSVPPGALARVAVALRSGGERDPARPDGRERLGLLDQTWAMVASGRLDPGSYLALVRAIAADEDVHVRGTAVQAVSRVAETWRELATTPEFAAFVRDALGAEARALGWDPRQGESSDDALRRPELLSTVGTFARERWILQGASARARAWLEDPSAIPAELAPVALSLATREGSLEVEAILAALERTQNPALRRPLLVALTNAPPGRPLAWTLGATLRPPFRKQDVWTVWQGAIEREETRAQAFALLRKRFDRLVARTSDFGSGGRGAGLASAVSSFCTTDERDAAVAFFRKRDLPGSERYLLQGIAAADRCIAMRTHGRQALRAWLGNPHGDGEASATGPLAPGPVNGP